MTVDLSELQYTRRAVESAMIAHNHFVEQYNKTVTDGMYMPKFKIELDYYMSNPKTQPKSTK